MFSCKACSGADPAKDTVKFDAAALARQQLEAEQAAAQSREAERRLQQQQEQEREEARLRDEEARRRRAEEAELQRQQEDQRRRAEEQARREETARQEQEEREAFERADAVKRAEQERLQREAAEGRARKSAVAGFLKDRGFKGGASDAKRSMMNTTYPLHTAAKEGNAQMIEMLLREGANAAQKNSSGKTAAQVAEKSNNGGSHNAVLRALTTGVGASGRIGGC